MNTSTTPQARRYRLCACGLIRRHGHCLVCGGPCNHKRRRCAVCRQAALPPRPRCSDCGQPCERHGGRCRSCWLLAQSRSRHVEREDLLEMYLGGMSPAQITAALGLRAQYVWNELRCAGAVRLSYQLGVYVGPDKPAQAACFQASK